MNLIEQIITLFKSKVLDAGGAEKSVYEYLQEGKVLKAVSMMQDRDDEVDNALREYNPELHEVMRRPNKFRKKCRLTSLKSYLGTDKITSMK